MPKAQPASASPAGANLNITSTTTNGANTGGATTTTTNTTTNTTSIGSSPTLDKIDKMTEIAMRKKKNADAQAAFRARRANYIATLEETGAFILVH